MDSMYTDLITEDTAFPGFWALQLSKYLFRHFTGALSSVEDDPPQSAGQRSTYKYAARPGHLQRIFTRVATAVVLRLFSMRPGQLSSELAIDY